MTERSYEALVKKIREHVSEPARLMQFAEECNEAAQAALKVARILDGTNPTPCTLEEERRKLREELGDVLNAAAVLGIEPEKEEQEKKTLRWWSRILVMKEETEE